MTTPIRHTISLYREVEGTRVEVQFVIDERQTILEERIIKPGTTVPLQVPATNSKEMELTRRGYKWHKDESGAIVIDFAPEREQQLIRFFTKDFKCNFPGCTELQKEYWADYEKIGGAECLDCDYGQLIQRYRAKMEALLAPAHAPKINSTGT